MNGGTGSDTFNVGGDVTSPIVARDVNGTSGFINHSVSSADSRYNSIFADGVPVSVANGTAGAVVVGQLTDASSNPLPQLAAFQQFSEGAASRVATPPMPTAAHIIGSYHPSALGLEEAPPSA